MRQTEALAILNAGANVFLTGAPGAGKTYVLNEFIRQARADGASVAVTASTGIASTHINGQTIHSWSGVGVATSLTSSLLKLIKSRRKRKIQATDILVIDEVSMLHAWLFDMVDQVCREVRRDPRPFGGIQVVLSGDLFQLPPVSVSGRNRDLIEPTPEFIASRERYARAGLNPESFITESLVWQELNPVICYLTEQHRQDTGELLTVLTDIREGDVTQSDRDALVTRLGKLPEPGQVAVHLFPVNRQADNLNDMRLNQIMLELMSSMPKPQDRPIWSIGSRRTCSPPSGSCSRKARPSWLCAMTPTASMSMVRSALCAVLRRRIKAVGRLWNSRTAISSP